MKVRPVFLGPALVVVLFGLHGVLPAQYQLAPTPPSPMYPPSAPPAPAPPAPPPASPKGDGKADAGESKILGLPIARSNGHWLGLAIEDGNFKLRFYDDKKQPEKPDIARASARWNPVGKVGDLRTVLNPGGDGQVLRGPQFVSPPYTFKVYLTLLSADDQVVESFVVQETAP